MRKPVSPTSKSKTSMSQVRGRRRRRWATTGAGGGSSGGSSVSGGSISLMLGSSITRMLRKTECGLLVVVCSACQVVAYKKISHEKAHKAQKKTILCSCALCAFLWLKFWLCE